MPNKDDIRKSRRNISDIEWSDISAHVQNAVGAEVRPPEDFYRNQRIGIFDVEVPNRTTDLTLMIRRNELPWFDLDRSVSRILASNGVPVPKVLDVLHIPSEREHQHDLHILIQEKKRGISLGEYFRDDRVPLEMKLSALNSTAETLERISEIRVQGFGPLRSHGDTASEVRGKNDSWSDYVSDAVESIEYRIDRVQPEVMDGIEDLGDAIIELAEDVDVAVSKDGSRMLHCRFGENQVQVEDGQVVDVVGLGKLRAGDVSLSVVSAQELMGDAAGRFGRVFNTAAFVTEHAADRMAVAQAVTCLDDMRVSLYRRDSYTASSHMNRLEKIVDRSIGLCL